MNPPKPIQSSLRINFGSDDNYVEAGELSAPTVAGGEMGLRIIQKGIVVWWLDTNIETVLAIISVMSAAAMNYQGKTTTLINKGKTLDGKVVMN